MKDEQMLDDEGRRIFEWAFSPVLKGDGTSNIGRVVGECNHILCWESVLKLALSA
jgi:hypothetical protein